MTGPSPVYTIQNVSPAFQLLWGFTIFWRVSPGAAPWLASLTQALEPDGIRLLRHRFVRPAISQFLVSTTPHVAPVSIAARVKGRLQHLLKHDLPRPFQRNYDLVRIGSTRGDKIEQYVAGQVDHHSDGIGLDAALLDDLQFVDPEYDLMNVRFTRHARCTCNLHIVLVNQSRIAVEDLAQLHATKAAIRRWAAQQQHLLSRVGLLPDHIHLTAGINPVLAPIATVVELMNAVVSARVKGQPLSHSCFIGTFGDYDLGTVREEPAAASWGDVGVV